MRVGTGWDIHQLIPERALVIGGVDIPSELGQKGHSDGDALIHSLIDALLGATTKGDIGTLFPPSDDRWKNISSLELLGIVIRELSDYTIEHIDSTVILEKPKLGPYITSIRISLAEACGISLEQVSVKAKTAEGLLGELGQGRAIVAQTVVLLEEKSNYGPEEWV